MTQYSGKIIRKNPVVPTQQSASGVWTTEDAAVAVRNNTWPVADVPDPISRSVRFRSSASAYFSRTPSVAGSTTTFTWSGWVKRGALGTGQFMFGCTLVEGSSYSELRFLSDNSIIFNNLNPSTGQWVLYTSQVFRDPSAWLHVVAVSDTNNATAGDRMRLYINGVRVTNFLLESYPSSGASWYINTTNLHAIGRYGSSQYFDGYMTEVNFIDGQALTPSSFGTTDAQTGAWIPMTYTGTYGTNGFYVDFRDNTSTTTLGYDYSGNNNTWTANNISLTAGATYDSMLDVPTPWVGYSATTDTSAVTRGNYATLNPVNTAVTLSSGNLDIASLSNSVYATMQVTSGKWYWEYTINGGSNYNYFIGVSNSTGSSYAAMGMCNGGNSPNAFNVATSTNGTVTQPTGSRPAQPATIGIKLDIDAGSIEFYINGTLNGSVTGITNWPSGNFWTPYLSSYTSTFGYQAIIANFGQRPFSQSVPSGFKALCTTNLPEPTIKNGAQYMAASRYTGNGTTQSIVNSGNNTTATTFQPDLVWIKSRSAAYNNYLYDFNRGTGTGASLVSNSTGAEGDNYLNANLTALNSTGFSVGTTFSTNQLNASSATFVAWQWKANGSTVSNSNGTRTSQVNANTTAGFSIATYSGSGANATVGHGLGVAPSMIIVKNRGDATTDWFVYHNVVGNTSHLSLNTTAASTSSATAWNNTSPTSSVFTIGTNNAVNRSGYSHVAYCFAAVAGYSAFGSYTGNGSTDGPFVYCGFRPRYVIFKASSTTGDWPIADSSRDTYNVMPDVLFADLSNAENNTYGVDFLSNGFKLRSTAGNTNSSGVTYIYMAFAENPFKYSNAR